MTNEIMNGKLPEEGFVRAADLVNMPAKGGKPARRGILPVSKSTLWKMVKDGKLAPPVKLSENVTAWPVSVIREYLARQTQAGA